VVADLFVKVTLRRTRWSQGFGLAASVGAALIGIGDTAGAAGTRWRERTGTAQTCAGSER
jgi:hypothetical protein